MEQEWVCDSPAAMRDLGRKLAQDLPSRACLALCGPLGAGKTQLVKGIAEGLGHPGPVTSPTFSLLQEYRDGREPLFHLDFYRVESAGELLALGWDELLEDGIVVAEWADKFAELLPPSASWIRIASRGETERLVQMGRRPLG